MASADFGALEIVTMPRLPIGRLCELRRFLDQIMIGLSSEDQVPAGGHKHGEVESSPEKSIRKSATGSRNAGAATTEGSPVTGGAANRGARITKRVRGFRKATGGLR